MQKHIFIIIRYSMLTKDGKAWVIGRGDRSKYITKLFDKNRLALHEYLFEKVTIPSIINQTLKLPKELLTVLILTSDELPNQNYNNLLRIVSPFETIQVLKMPSNGTQSELIERAINERLKKFTQKVCYCTTRLDDDDALSRDFVEVIMKYVNPEFSGYAVSFGKGIAGIMNDKSNKFVSFHEIHQINCAQGLSYINSTFAA